MKLKEIQSNQSKAVVRPVKENGLEKVIDVSVFIHFQFMIEGRIRNNHEMLVFVSTDDMTS